MKDENENILENIPDNDIELTNILFELTKKYFNKNLNSDILNNIYAKIELNNDNNHKFISNLNLDIHQKVLFLL